MKLLALTVNKNDSTSFYRANGVFSDLKNQMPLEISSLNFDQLQNFSWANLSLVDAVFMQRPYKKVAVDLASFCREMNIPVWIDYDDNLLDIPIANFRAYDEFMVPEVQQNVVKLIGLANVLSVSTAELKRKFEQINPNIRVIPNAINTTLLNYRREPKTTKTIIWRGSETHQLDIFLYADPIFNAIEKFKEWQFTWFGYYPWFIPQMPNSKYIKATDPILYFKQLYAIAPQIIHVPLADSLFNHCKSNIAYIEGTFAGSVCLVPAWAEWKLPGAVTYNTPDEYAHQLDELLNNRISAKARNAEAWQYITDTLQLSTINRQRVELLNELVG